MEKNFIQKTAGSTKESVTKAIGNAGQAAGNVKGVAAKAGGKVSGAFGNVFRRKKDEGSNPGTDAAVVICVNCKNEVAVGYKFCPACGQPIAT